MKKVTRELSELVDLGLLERGQASLLEFENGALSCPCTMWFSGYVINGEDKAAVG